MLGGAPSSVRKAAFAESNNSSHNNIIKTRYVCYYKGFSMRHDCLLGQGILKGKTFHCYYNKSLLRWGWGLEWKYLWNAKIYLLEDELNCSSNVTLILPWDPKSACKIRWGRFISPSVSFLLTTELLSFF